MSKEKTLLIVDDLDDLRDALADAFESRGFQVLASRDGKAALDLMENQSIHFVLSDIRMPNMDGVELLKAIKSRHGVSVQVLLMSGFSDYSKEAVIALGALGLVDKPFDFDSVAELIRAAWSKETLV